MNSRCLSARRLCQSWWLLLLLAAAPAWAQGSGVITGTVIDSETKRPLGDVLVTATSPTLQGEKTVVTDSSGAYRLPQLPPGQYTLRLEIETYRPYERGGITLRVDTTLRVNVELLPEAILGEELLVIAQAPVVDVGSASTGVSVNSELTRRLAVGTPGGRGSSSRSFESLAELAPGTKSDTYGVSISGTTSPENGFVIDGLSVSDPAFGILGTPLSVEFVQEVNVISGGFLPEFGRATGGVMNVVTKSGSNEFHGSVFGTMTPGALERAPRALYRGDTTIGTDVRLWNQGDFGAELGGPILQDKLWFYVGVASARSRHQLTRGLYARALGEDGAYVLDERGNPATSLIADTEQRYFADLRSYQYLGKLTYNLNQDHSLSLSVYGTPFNSGGGDRFGYDPEDGRPEVRNFTGSFDALAHKTTNDVRDVALKLNSAFMNKRLLLDASVGWHHQSNTFLPSDGSELGSSEGLAGVPRFNFRRARPHSINDFEVLADPSVCDAAGSAEARLCPVADYAYAGPGRLNDDVLDRYQAKLVGTYLFSGLGHHVAKAGVDIEQMVTSGRVAFSGQVTYRETRNGRFWQDHRSMGYMTGPDQAQVVPLWETASRSSGIGLFLQDSWAVLDKVSVNFGLRYDTQTMWGTDDRVAVVLPHQVSPRIGVIYDPTQQGRAKLFANFARYYQNTVMEMVNAQFPGERRLQSFRHREGNASRPGCDPLRQQAPYTECRDPANLRSLWDAGYTHEQDPNLLWLPVRGDNGPVDPNLRPQSSDELVLGGEYQLVEDTRLGLTYTRRQMNSVIEDMSRDEATSFFLGNPGEGIASDFPKAERNYDAVTLFMDKRFSNKWLGQVSYTWSRLYGNYTGLFRPESGQLAPNITSDFDLVSLLENRTGLLQGDRTHSLKAFGARDFELPGGGVVNVGLTYRGSSGAPLNVVGSHPLYGTGQVYILPRGAGGRLPWTHTFDTRLGVGYPLGKMTATISMDVFNLFNFQQVVEQDANYTLDEVKPLLNGTAKELEGLTNADGDPVTQNPNYGNATLYQSPRSLRISARLSF